jgi:hypothetical protein
LLRRVLQVDALACPRCSTPTQAVPMTVLAFLSDPEVVGKILRHLGLPTTVPALAGGETSVPGDREYGHFGAKAAISPPDPRIRARDRW